MLLQSSLEEGHAGYTRYTSKEYLDHAFASAIKQCDSAKQEWDFFRLVSETVTAIKDGHTRVTFPEPLEKEVDEKLLALPFFVFVEEDRAVIAQNLRETRSTLKGSEILSINGIPTRLILQRLRLATPVDGDIPTAKNRRIEGWAFSRGLLSVNNLRSPYVLVLKNPQGRVLNSGL
jgi:hypothetical protein